MSDNLSDRLQRTFDRARAASEQRGFIYGTVGRQNENGSYSVVVAGRPNYLYVTVDGEQASTIARAENTQRKAGLPVKMKYEGGELVIKGVNPLAQDAFEGGAGGSVAFHNHNEHSGLEYPINSTRLKQGRVRFVTALTVHIGEFAYSHLGDWRWWPGGNIDLTSVKPAGAGTWAWVLVGVDPATNAAVAVAGAGQATGMALTVDQIESIAFNGYIPCGAVRVRADDTALNLASRYADARIWLEKLGLLALGELGDVTLTAPANGQVLTYSAGVWVNAASPGDVAGSISGAAEKTTPVGADKFGLVDSEAPDAGVLKWLSWTNLVAGVQAAIDSVYFRLGGRAGGQVAHGGTASGETLTLRGSLDAVSGGVVVDDDVLVNGQATARRDGANDTNITAQNLDNVDTSARAGLAAQADTALFVFQAHGSAHTGTTFGVSRANVGRFISVGASAMVFGTFGVVPIILGTDGVQRMQVAGDGRVSIGPSFGSSAKLDIQGTDGALRLPRLTTAQRDALSAANGDLIYNSSTNTVQARAGGSWVNL